MGNLAGLGQGTALGGKNLVSLFRWNFMDWYRWRQWSVGHN